MTRFADPDFALGTRGATIEEEGEAGSADATDALGRVQRRRQTLGGLVFQSLKFGFDHPQSEKKQILQSISAILFC